MTSMPDPADLIPVMRRLALEAGALILDVYNSEDFDVRSKSDDSPVTEADETADRHISEGLVAAFPDLPLVTEEQSHTHDLEAKSFLIVDPLDGTKEFIQRRGDFTVNIAWVEDGTPKYGVVYAPAKERLFYTGPDGKTVEEGGALDPATPGETKPLTVRTPDNDGLYVVASKSHRDEATDAYISRYALADTKSAGSSLKFCLLAAGEADLYPRLGRTMEWDTAAGHAVLTGAGGAVLDRETLQPLGYGKPGFANPHFIAHVPGVTLARE